MNPEDFQKPLLEKLIWISAFMLVGARHPGATVGIVEKDFNNEVVFLVYHFINSIVTVPFNHVIICFPRWFIMPIYKNP